jgi:transposase
VRDTRLRPIRAFGDRLNRGDSRIGRVLILPAGWMEASRDGWSLFSGFAQPCDLRWGSRGMSRRGAASALASAIRLRSSGSSVSNGRLRTAGKMGGHRRLKLEPQREFLEACHAQKPDATLKWLCDRLLSERGVKADTSLMSQFLRRLGLTPKKRRSWRASRTART